MSRDCVTLQINPWMFEKLEIEEIFKFSDKLWQKIVFKNVLVSARNVRNNFAIIFFQFRENAKITILSFFKISMAASIQFDLVQVLPIFFRDICDEWRAGSKKIT